MAKLKNARNNRLMDSKGRFNLAPGETVTMTTVPKDIASLVTRGFLINLDAKKQSQKASGPTKPSAKKDEDTQAGAKASTSKDAETSGNPPKTKPASKEGGRAGVNATK